MTAKVRKVQCMGCGACKAVCPIDAIRIKVIAVVDPEKCASCGLCTESCPQFAIKV